MRVLAALCLLWVAACKPEVQPPPDAGDEAWVRRVVPLLWGRGPEGLREVDLLVKMVQQTDRAALVRAMARSPEYVTHWTEITRDLLYVNRTGDRGNAACFGVSRLPAIDAELATFVRDHAPEAGEWDAPWSMQDLTHSALVLDDLSPVLRAHLFAQLAKDIPLQGVDSALIVEENLYGVFEETYLNRQMACLSCHNSDAAVTDNDDPDLDRHWPLPGKTERAVFGSSLGRDPKDLYTLFRKHGVLSGYDIFDQLYGFPATGCFPTFVTGCDGCSCESTVCDLDPTCCTVQWAPHCAELCTDTGLGCLPGVPEGWQGCSSLYGYPGCDGCACEWSVCDAHPECCEDSWSEVCALRCRILDSTCESFDWADYYYGGLRVWGMHQACGTFLPPAEVLADPVAIPTYLISDLGMDATVYHLERPIQTGFRKLREGYVVGERDEEDGDAALAFMISARFANAVWDKATGSPLTIANHFSRNEAQRDILQRLTTAFGGGGASIVELLVALTAEPYWNPIAPRDMEEGLSAYAMAAVWNPWVRDYDLAEQRLNSVGDVVHRKDPRVLTRSVTHALGFPPWAAFPAGTDVGDEGKLQEQLGFFLKDSIHGFAGNDYQGQAAWEHAFGACSAEPERQDGCGPRQTPGCAGCACEEAVCRAAPVCCDVRWDQRCHRFCTDTPVGCRAGEGVDIPTEEDFWLPRLVVAARARAAAGETVTLADLVSAVKDRLLADPEVTDPDEIAAIEALVLEPLSTPVDQSEDPVRALQWACAAFLSAPQFQLDGVALPDRLGLPPPSITVEGTETQALCERFSAALPAGSLRCEGGNVTFRHPPPP